MAKFAWAYINCSGAVDENQPSGPPRSIQFVTSSTARHTTGSAKLVYYTGSYSGYTPSSLVLSGNFHVSGTISASVFHVKDTSIIDATGSTYFGDSNDDVHMRTGSLVVSTVAGNLILSTSYGQQAAYVKGFGGGYTAVAVASYAITNGDYILGVRRGNYITMSLPAPTAGNTGRVFLIKDEFENRGTGSIYVTGASAGFTIDHSDSYVMSGSSPAISLYSNGSNWFVF